MKEFYGFFGAQSGDECWFDGGNEGMIKVIYKNSMKELYCKYAKITVAEVSKEEVEKYFEDKENKCKNL